MPRKNILQIGLVGLSIVIGLSIVEAVLRVLNRPSDAPSGWRSFVDKSEWNQMGFRGQSIEYAKDDFVIVLLGDSAVEAVACGYEWMPERRLQFHLNSAGKKVKVFSLGTSGYGQDQELLALREYFEKYRADMVLLWFAETNDIWNNVFPTHFPADGAPKPTYWLEGGRLRGPSEAWGRPIRETPRLKLQLLWRNLFHWSRDREWEKRYPPAYRPMTQTNEPAKNDWQQRWNDNIWSMRSENLDTEKSHYTIYLTPRSERTQYSLDLTRKLLGEIQGSIQARGGQFVMFNLVPPDEFTSLFEGVHVLNGKYYRTSMAQYHSNLDYTLNGFRSYSIPIGIEQWKVGPQNPHLNEHANDQLMKDLATRIESLVPSAK